ncbi:MAG: hypothetical protein KDD42_00065, partial [Bdellovibrionales bacterium]|nr:hypothetical protein [Bdellovibrionales bacterium]
MQLLPAHPALIARSNQLSFGLIVVLRSFFWIAAILALDGLLELGTSVAALAAMAVVGVLTASLLAFSRLTTLGFILLLLMLYIGYQVSFELLQFLPTSTTSVFLLYNLLQHTNNLFGAFVLAAISSWFFWRHEQTATWEILSLCFLGVYLLSGHRNFHFDTPALINNLAWSFGVEHLSMLIILGTAILLFALIYLFFATLPSRPIAGKSDKLTRSHWGRHTILSRAVPAIALITLIFVVARQVFNHYSATAASITANGVGQKAEEGLSPLSFHSALGSTNQPSALVRLEGDYATNPFSPMLYLRESALSDFNGHEMVLAGEGFDSDIAKTRPEEPFIGKEDVSLTYRTPLEQSIFLLTEHDYAFAVDYPIAIKRLKNPDTARFNAAFKAYSMAPAYSLEQLKGHTVGDERWSKGQLDHYITP